MTTRDAPGNPYVDDPDETLSTSEWGSDETVEKSAETPIVSTVHKPLGTHGLWGSKSDQLPAYVQNVAHALIRGGMDESEAIATAVNSMKRWAAGGGDVTPEVRAAAGRALGEWEALRAKHGGGK